MWRKKRKNAKASHLRQKMYNIFLGSVLAAGIVLYLIQANGLATKGYKIKDLKQSIKDVTRVQKELEIQSLNLQSMGALSEKLENIEMVEAKQAVYIYADTKTVYKK